MEEAAAVAGAVDLRRFDQMLLESRPGPSGVPVKEEERLGKLGVAESRVLQQAGEDGPVIAVAHRLGEAEAAGLHRRGEILIEGEPGEVIEEGADLGRYFALDGRAGEEGQQPLEHTGGGA